MGFVPKTMSSYTMSIITPPFMMVLQIFRGQAIPFKHNDMRQLEQILTGLKLRNNQSLFIVLRGYIPWTEISHRCPN
jgi:hypothetical protein